MFQILTGLNLPRTDICIHRFVKNIFSRLGQEEQSFITWDVFRSNAKTIETYLRTLGSRDVSCYHTPCSKKRGKHHMVFGSQKWRFITNMMLGLEFAIRGTREQLLEVITPQPSPRNFSQLVSDVPPPYLHQDSSGYTLKRTDSSVSGNGEASSNDSVNGSTVGGSNGASYAEKLRQDLQSRSCCTKEVFMIPTGDGSKCQIASYGAEQFQAVRRACNIEDDDFLLSVGIRQVIGSLLLGDLFGLSEQVIVLSCCFLLSLSLVMHNDKRGGL